MLSRKEIKKALSKWYRAWNEHDLDGVLALCHDEILFVSWVGGKVKGKENLCRAWASWFANHGGFRFAEEETFIDEAEQKALFRWQLEWSSREKGYEGKPEKRQGVDVLHFRDGKIVKKLTYAKTTIGIDGEDVRLTPETP